MATEYSTKKVTELTNTNTAADADLLAIGDSSTGQLKKITLSNFWNYVKNKISSVTYALNCGAKSLTAAINDICQGTGDQEYVVWECGVLTTTNKEIYITSPTRKTLANRTVSSVLLTALSVRQGGSYLVNESYNASGLTGYEVTVSPVATGIRCVFTKTSGGQPVSFGGTNNELCHVYARITVTWG